MKEIDFLDAVGRVDQKYIEECLTYKPPKTHGVWIKRISAVAACLLVVITTVFLLAKQDQPIIIDENGFYIENGVLLRYTGDETEVTVPETVTAIADYAFMENTNASKIKVVRLGSSVTTVETNALAGLDGLIDLIIAEENLSFESKDGLILTSDGTILLHYGREGETHFTIPESVRYVAAHAVQATSLETIDFGENLEYIGFNAFASNHKLKAIILPDSLKYVSEGAFSGCGSAVDGYIPSGVQFGGEAFFSVPFYLTMQAGHMSPLEERVRGLVTPSEEIARSNLSLLEAQITYTLAGLRGDTLTPTDDATRRAFAVGSDAPEIPDGMVIPTEFSLSDLTYTDGTGIYDACIHIPAGEYTIVLQATPYNLNTVLNREDVEYYVLNLFYMQSPEAADPEDTVTAFGWTAVFGHEDGKYSGITYTHEDGTIIRSHLPNPSDTPYKLTFSPSGTRVAVEGTIGTTQPFFYIQSLNGDKLLWEFSDYNEYLNKYYGQYVADTLTWADDDNIEGENIYGRFRFNIYASEVTMLEEKPDIIDVVTTRATVDAVEDSLVDGRYTEFRLHSGDKTKVFYGKALKDYSLSMLVVYAHVNDDNVEDIIVILTNADGAGTNLSVHTEEIHVFDGVTLDDIPCLNAAEIVERNVSFREDDSYFYAELPDKTCKIKKTYTTGGNLPEVGRIETYYISDGKLVNRSTFQIPEYNSAGEIYRYTPYGEIRITYGFDGKIFAAETIDFIGNDHFPYEEENILDLLSMTVGELRNAYGEMHLEYSEHGPGQPVYSFRDLPGVLAVFHGLHMDTPPADDAIPNEFILTEAYGKSVHGLQIGKAVPSDARHRQWFDAWYDLINGTAYARAIYKSYSVTAAIRDFEAILPDEVTATVEDWDTWARYFMLGTTGTITRLRIAAIPSTGTQVDALPHPAEEARLSYSVIGGTPKIYVYEDDLTFYMHYLSAADAGSLYRCAVPLPKDYTNGRIVYVEGSGGSGEFYLYIEAERYGEKAILAYLYECDGSPTRLIDHTTVEGEWLANIQEQISPDKSEDVTRLLSMTVAELREIYGKMRLKMTEQTVYDFVNLPGVLFDFYTLEMNTPPNDGVFPGEIILTEEYGQPVHGLSVGATSSEDAAKIPWFDAWYDATTGKVHARVVYGTYTVTAVFSGNFTDLPSEDAATETEWDAWAERFMQSPEGNICEIRIRPIPALSEQQDSLPLPAEEARLTCTFMVGSPVIYVFEDGLTFFIHYLSASPSGTGTIYRCSALLPEGYTNGRIVEIKGYGGSGEFRVYIEAERNGSKETLAYQYAAGGSPVHLSSREIATNEQIG